jgi:hypothetical protein
MTLELTGNDAPKLQVSGQFTGFRAMRSIPGCFICLIGAITLQTIVTVDFPANRRGKESLPTIPLDISSRSERVSASLERWRSGGRKPPKRAKFLVIAE